MSEQVLNITPDQAQGASQGSNEAISAGFTEVGLFAAILAFAQNIPAGQKLTTELIGLSAFISKLQQELSHDWQEIISGDGPDSVLSRIQAELASSDSPKEKASKINALTAEFQIDETSSNELNSFLEGENNGVNQVAASGNNALAGVTKAAENSVVVGTFVTKLLAGAF